MRQGKLSLWGVWERLSTLCTGCSNSSRPSTGASATTAGGPRTPPPSTNCNRSATPSPNGSTASPKSTSKQPTSMQADRIWENNRLESDEEELMDSSQSYALSSVVPRVMFNEIALRRANQSLSRVIYTQAKFKSGATAKKLKNSNSSKKLSHIEPPYTSLCKFVQSTNILFQYILQDPQNQEPGPLLHKIEFREFVVPMRSACVTLGPGVYLLGGYNKDGKLRKEVYYYERMYTTMRVIGLMKEGRVGHALCAYEDSIYIFGGKGTNSLEQFNTKTKTSQILTQTKHSLTGSSMTALSHKLYIFGGTTGIDLNPVILIYDLRTHKMHELASPNASLYPIPITPILQPISQHEILIFGGYYLFGGLSYNSTSMLLFDDRLNYLSIYGKGELIYPILSNGSNCVLRDAKIVCLADLKRQRNRHGPNLPVVFAYGLADQSMGLDCVGL